MTIRSFPLVVAASAAVALTACGPQQPKETPSETETAYGIPTELMDSTAEACSNFFEYANGQWLKDNPIPSTESSWNSFLELRDNNNEILINILKEASANTGAEKGSNTQWLGDFYYTAMDTTKLEADGMTPIKGLMEKINSVGSKADLATTVAHLHSQGIGAMFYMGVRPDAKKSDEYAISLWQGGLGLPDRDYYFRDDERSQNIRDEYQAHLNKMFTLMDYDEDIATNASEAIMKLETALAEASRKRVQLRDAEANYNKTAVAELATTYPNLNLDGYFAAVGVDMPDSIIIGQPEFLAQLDKLIADQNIETWRTYLIWGLINNTAGLLSSEFETQDFYFYRTVLRGTKEMKPRWERALAATNGSLGEVLGQEFVKQAFTPETKAKADQMVKNLIVALRGRLENLEWMSEETKPYAFAKIDKLRTKIGYPDKWKDWTGLEIDRSSFAQNVLNCNAIGFQQMIDRMGQPIDRDEWFMSPQTVNAYYNPTQNEIVFPAAILQPPFYDPNADEALNYGGIGAVIGHELTHGFDDQGNRFDADGNLKNWWAESDYKNFRERADKVIEQFNGYEAAPDLFVNGALTVGENIADLGGLTIALSAYEQHLETAGREDIDGLSPEQRFFLAWAQVWKGKYTDESLAQQVQTNPHSPAMYRVIGPMQNIPEFHQAFSCSGHAPADSTMVSIW